MVGQKIFSWVKVGEKKATQGKGVGRMLNAALKYMIRVSTELKLKFQLNLRKKVTFFQSLGQNKCIVFQPYHEF